MITFLYWCRPLFLLGLGTAVCWLGYLAWLHDHD
jgi:hypothetical protein